MSDLIAIIRESAPPGYQQDEQDFTQDWLPNCGAAGSLRLTWVPWTPYPKSREVYARVQIDLVRNTVLFSHGQLTGEEYSAFASFRSLLESRLAKEQT